MTRCQQGRSVDRAQAMPASATTRSDDRSLDDEWGHNTEQTSVQVGRFLLITTPMTGLGVSCLGVSFLRISGAISTLTGQVRAHQVRAGDTYGLNSLVSEGTRRMHMTQGQRVRSVDGFQTTLH